MKNKALAVLASAVFLLFFLLFIVSWAYDIRRVEVINLQNELFYCQNKLPQLTYFTDNVDDGLREICLEKRDNCVILHERCYCIWDDWAGK
jgi:hypothetical protein